MYSTAWRVCLLESMLWHTHKVSNFLYTMPFGSAKQIPLFATPSHLSCNLLLTGWTAHMWNIATHCHSTDTIAHDTAICRVAFLLWCPLFGVQCYIPSYGEFVWSCKLPQNRQEVFFFFLLLLSIYTPRTLVPVNRRMHVRWLIKSHLQ